MTPDDEATMVQQNDSAVLQATVADWLALCPLLQGQGWYKGRRGELRNRDGWCPLVALAKLVDPSVCATTEIRQAWSIVGAMSYAMSDIARAADFPRVRYRRPLERALGMCA